MSLKIGVIQHQQSCVGMGGKGRGGWVGATYQISQSYHHVSHLETLINHKELTDVNVCTSHQWIFRQYQTEGGPENPTRTTLDV